MDNSAPESKVFFNLTGIEYIAEKIVCSALESLFFIQEELKTVTDLAHQELHDLGKAISKATRPLCAIEKMGDAQFVWWNYMTNLSTVY